MGWREAAAAMGASQSSSGREEDRDGMMDTSSLTHWSHLKGRCSVFYLFLYFF
jgi:hypothetical protein